ncbi:hypothetical protein ACE103_09525 [Bradyrhizobium sp. ma5]|uniref:hypothetical protein n=1 Tax=Bradyrhizobium sp. ma5 TaxID=3344828 RepID=UPI0035D4DAB8
MAAAAVGRKASPVRGLAPNEALLDDPSADGGHPGPGTSGGLLRSAIPAKSRSDTVGLLEIRSDGFDLHDMQFTRADL